MEIKTPSPTQSTPSPPKTRQLFAKISNDFRSGFSEFQNFGFWIKEKIYVWYILPDNIYYIVYVCGCRCRHFLITPHLWTDANSIFS